MTVVSAAPPLAVVAPMFDTYMNAHALDPRARRQTSAALGAAAAACVLVLAGAIGAQRLSVTRVGAPHVELDFLLATTTAMPPASPPPPAPAPAAAAAPADDEPDPTPRPRDTPRDELIEPGARTSARPGVPGATGDGTGLVPGVTGPIGGGGLPCPIPGTCNQVLPPAVPRIDRTPVEDARVPLSVIRSRLRFSPDPSRVELARTPAGVAGRGGTSVVEFCITPDGRVDAVRTKRSAGDREVDRICRDTLARWRFSPTQVQGQAKRTCSEFAFEIAFE